MNDNGEVRNFTYDLTETNFRQFNKYFVLHSTKNRWVGVLLRYVFFLAYIALLTWAGLKSPSGFGFENVWYFDMVFIGVLLFQIWTEWIAPIVRSRRILGATGRRTFAATPGYAEAGSPFFCARHRWSAYLKVMVSRDLVMLFVTNKTAHLIPASAFQSEADMHAFVNRVENYRLEDRAFLDRAANQPAINVWPPAPKAERQPLLLPDPQPDPKIATRLDYDITAADNRWANLGLLLLRTFGPGTVVIVVVTVINSSTYGGVLPALIHLGPFYLAYVAVIAVTRYAQAHKALIAANKNTFIPTRLVTDFKTLQLATGSTATSYNVSSFSKVRNSIRNILIYTNPWNMLVVPKRAFATPADATAFVERMKAAIAAGKGGGG